MTSYDAWLEAPYQRESSIVGEDYLGARVVVDGAWGTIEQGWVEVDEELDSDGCVSRSGGVVFEVSIDAFYGGGTATISESEAEEQTRIGFKNARARKARQEARDRDG
jgi:hypothetical protein